MEKSDHSNTDFLRKEELASYHIFGTEPEPELDEIVILAAKLCEVPVALICFNDGNHHWFKARYGFDEKEIYLENSISAHSQRVPEHIFEIYDLRADERFKEHPMMQNSRDSRFCASMPLISKNGFAIGNLILVDTVPKMLSENQRDILKILGRQTMHFLNLRRKRILLEKTQSMLEQQNTLLEETSRELNDYKTALDSSAIVTITDVKGDILVVNDTFCKISGYSREELIGQNQRIVNSSYHSREFWTKMWRTISSGKIWREEIRNQTKLGEHYWVDTTIVPFMDEKTRKPIKYLSIRHDITEQKNIQQAEMQSLLFAQEIDRDNFAEELHEGLAQRLVAIRLSAQIMEAKLPKDIAQTIQSTLDFISEQLKVAIDETKDMAIDLMPRSMMNDGLVASLHNYFARIETKYQINCDFKAEFSSFSMNAKNIEITIYRVVVSLVEKAILSKVIHSIEIELLDLPSIHATIRIHSAPLLGKNYAKPLSSYFGFLGQLSRRVELSGGQLIMDDSEDQAMTEIHINFD